MPARSLVVTAVQAGKRLDVFLASVLPEISRSQLTRHIAEGAVFIGGARGVPSRKVRAGDVVEWSAPAVVATEIGAEAIPLVVVHEDPHLIVIDKPPGLVVHPAPGHPTGTLVNALLSHVADLRGIGGELRPGIVHRIDKDTSGLLVIAKDDQTMNALGAAFKAHDINRVYEALVIGKPGAPSGRIDTLYGRDVRDRKKFSIKVRAGKRAVTKWRVVEPLGAAVRLEAELETGRTHQVRVHMAALGLPLLGDLTYGKTPRDPVLKQIATTLGRQALHARTLGFRHPATGKWMEFTSQPPADFAAALGALRALAGAEPLPRASKVR
ncbi:MAG: RluA family pseudouridine synthase [Deltaproteobacteria bacterium]|nr:RluA family pseudouridine synthase [Deltaproteobacteria bacterium]